MTEAEKKRLTELKAKGEPTDEEKAELKALEAKAAADNGAGDKSYGEAYVKELRSEAAKYRTKMKEFETRLAQFDGFDIDEYHRLKDAQEALEHDKLTKAGEFDKLRQKLVDEHTKELGKEKERTAALEVEVENLKKELQQTIIRNEIASAASVAKALNPKLVEMAVMSQVRIEEIDGVGKVIRVIEPDGTPRINIKTGKPLTILELMEDMRQSEEYAMLFAGGVSGAGSKTTHSFGGSNIKNPWKKDTFNLTLQAQIVRQSPELAAKLKTEAGY